MRESSSSKLRTVVVPAALCFVVAFVLFADWGGAVVTLFWLLSVCAFLGSIAGLIFAHRWSRTIRGRQSALQTHPLVSRRERG